MGHWVTAIGMVKMLPLHYLDRSVIRNVISRSYDDGDGGGRKLYDETLAKVGFDYIGSSICQCSSAFGWFKKNVTKVSDVKGMKYRTVGLATNVLTAMGMVVRQLPGGEIQPAMKTGLIVLLSLTTRLQTSTGMQDVSKHYHLGKLTNHKRCLKFQLIRRHIIVYRLHTKRY